MKGGAVGKAGWPWSTITFIGRIPNLTGRRSLLRRVRRSERSTWPGPAKPSRLTGLTTKIAPTASWPPPSCAMVRIPSLRTARRFRTACAVCPHFSTLFRMPCNPPYLFPFILPRSPSDFFDFLFHRHSNACLNSTHILYLLLSISSLSFPHVQRQTNRYLQSLPVPVCQ